MKLRTLTLITALGGLLGYGCAHEQTAGTQANTGDTYLTGSYLPQSVQRNGPVTNGKNDVRVIDQSELERSGGTDVRQSLRQLGVNQ